MERYRLDLIGPFGLFGPDGERIEITSQKAMALMALVVVSPGGVRARRKLEAMLWGSRGAKQAQDSLRRELSNLRKTLTRHGAGDLLICETKRVALAIDRIDVDVFALGLGKPGAPAHGAGEFLEGMDLPDSEAFEDWLRDERDRVDDMLQLVLPEGTEHLPPSSQILGQVVPDAGQALDPARRPLPPPKPSVAVLPFGVLGAVAQPWVGIGLAGEVGVCLSAIPQLFIVAGSASRALAEEGCTPTEIARRLGVRYLLDGTILADGEDLRVQTSLIDGGTGEQFWSETFFGRVDATFAFQQEIAGRIAPQIWTKVDTAERQRSLRLTGPISGDYERYWRANALFRSWERDAIAEAMSLTQQLVNDDPTCPWATSLAAYCHSIAYLMNYAPDRQATLRRAIQNYQAAMRFGAENVEALGYCVGTLINIGGDMDLADRIVASALLILPAHQPTLFWGGWVDILLGNAERATERFELALRINPVTGALSQTLTGIGFAALLRGKAEDGYRFLSQADKAAPGFPPALVGLCVSAQVTGRADEARELAHRLDGGVGKALAQQMRNPGHRLFLEALLEAAGTSAADCHELRQAPVPDTL